MVESSELLLGPWLAADRSIYRTVFNATHDTIGSIHRSTPRWTWVPRPRFEIREGDDHSLLFSVSPRSWVPGRWLVHDADLELVGTLIRRSGQRSIQAFGRTGLPLAELSWLPAMSVATAVSPRGACLCDIGRQTNGARIAFAAQTDPFSRMVFLAASLVAGV
jgi:hypothetical protein